MVTSDGAIGDTKGPALSLYAWSHIAFVYDGAQVGASSLLPSVLPDPTRVRVGLVSSSQVTFYVNGESVGSSALTGTVVASTACTLLGESVAAPCAT